MDEEVDDDDEPADERLVAVLIAIIAPAAAERGVDRLAAMVADVIVVAVGVAVDIRRAAAGVALAVAVHVGVLMVRHRLSADVADGVAVIVGMRQHRDHFGLYVRAVAAAGTRSAARFGAGRVFRDIPVAPGVAERRAGFGVCIFRAAAVITGCCLGAVGGAGRVVVIAVRCEFVCRKRLFFVAADVGSAVVAEHAGGVAVGLAGGSRCCGFTGIHMVVRIHTKHFFACRAADAGLCLRAGRNAGRSRCDRAVDPCVRFRVCSAVLCW